MKTYEVKVTSQAELQMKEYLAYLLYVKLNEQAYESVRTDFHETVDQLALVADSMQDAEEYELAKRKLRKMYFRRHDYVMLYRIREDVVEILYVFHMSEDYVKKL